MSNTYTLSLTRWHKVVERLTKSYSEIAVALKEGFCNTRVAGYAGEEQIRRLREKSAALEAQYSLGMELEPVIVAIRQELAKANVEVGVSGDLARYDWLMRRQRLIQSLLDGQTLNQVSIADLKANEIQGVVDSDEDSYSRRYATRMEVRLMEVRLMGEAFENQLRKDLAGVQAESYALSDVIAEKNRARISLELPDAIARLAGLA